MKKQLNEKVEKGEGSKKSVKICMRIISIMNGFLLENLSLFISPETHRNIFHEIYSVNETFCASAQR